MAVHGLGVGLRLGCVDPPRWHGSLEAGELPAVVAGRRVETGGPVRGRDPVYASGRLYVIVLFCLGRIVVPWSSARSAYSCASQAQFSPLSLYVTLLSYYINTDRVHDILIPLFIHILLVY